MRISSHQRQVPLNRIGFSIIELMVVLALIGLTTSIGAVYISSHETELRRFAGDVRFQLERAKQEALIRKSRVNLVLSYDPPSLDCNGNGLVDSEDRCYLIYEDLDGDGLYTSGTDTEIERAEPSLAIRLMNEEGINGLTFSFSPTGESRAKDALLKAAVKVEEGCCESQCMAVSYPLSVSHVGRIRLKDKNGGCWGEPGASCLDSSFCSDTL